MNSSVAINNNKKRLDILAHPYFYHFALLRIEQIGPLTFKKCLQHFKSPKETFEASYEQLRAIGLQQKIIEQIKLFKKEESAHPIYLAVQKDIEWLNQPNHFLLSAQDAGYPPLLKEIHDYPPLLFVIGNVSLLSSKQIAVVGSRRPSRAGSLDAHYFSKSLVENNFVISSGLASGIDSYAHEGALEADCNSTLAVLAHGLDGIFPKRNQNLAAKIINNGGALVSEFPIGVMPKPEYFPRRNRIISGLSLGVLVVEAAVKSGSLITAYCALEQNREVFAIPGSIHNPVARGCHKLIKDGAKLVETCEDILEDLQGFEPNCNNQTSMSPKEKEQENLTDIEQIIIKHLDHEEIDINEIAEMLKLPINEVAANLTLLELKGLVLKGEAGFLRKP